MDQATARATPRGKTAGSARSSSHGSLDSCYRGTWSNGIDGDSVLVKLNDRQSKRIDELVLWIDFGLVADLFGVQVIGNAQHPMFDSGLARVDWRVMPIKR